MGGVPGHDAHQSDTPSSGRNTPPDHGQLDHMIPVSAGERRNRR